MRYLGSLKSLSNVLKIMLQELPGMPNPVHFWRNGDIISFVNISPQHGQRSCP